MTDDPTLTISTHVDAAVSTVVLVGEIDMDNAGVLRGALLDLLAARPGVLRVDMSAVEFCDSSGLNALITAHGASAAQGTEFAIAAVSSQVAYLFRVAGLESLLGAERGGREQDQDQEQDRDQGQSKQPEAS